jgi:integrase
MAKQAWTDQWVRELPHPREGEPERVYRDPSVAGHRLTITRNRKKFEVQAKWPKRLGGKTFVVITGDALDCTVEQARDMAATMLARIRKGEDPRGRSAEKETTLGGAWTKYKERGDLRPRTRAMYDGMYRRNLEPWAGESLRTLVMNPTKAHDEHKVITKRSGPSEADHAMRLLRSIYRHAARLDTSLPGDRNPCSAVEWHGDKKRTEGAIPAKMMPAWKKQLEAVRKRSPIRAAFQILLLRLGCRPNELASSEWWQVDFKRRVFWIPEHETDGAKVEPYEVPLSSQAVAEFKKLLEARGLNSPGKDHVFPSRMGKHAKGHLVHYSEKTLSHRSNKMRHTHHTLGTRLGIKEIIVDVMEGRSIIASGSAGRGYIDTHELGPELRKGQEIINQEIDRLFAGKGR